jgi:Na+-translocating ferredoxin:NAD+ oxidoreductase RnfD subunit
MKNRFNPLLVAYSLISISFVVLAFTVNPYLMIGAVVFMLLGRAEMKKGKK